jgi:hypothetical protein
MEIKLQKLKCIECEHEWLPRVKQPLKCPRCQTYGWDSALESDKKKEGNE